MRSDTSVAIRARDLACGDFGGEKGNTNSLSGHERDHVFLRLPSAGNYADIAGVTGVDDEGDGRIVAPIDLDRDGWLDLVVVNANFPRLLVYRNRLAAAGVTGGMLAVRLEGGMKEALPGRGRSPRDAFGAQVTVRVAERRLVRHLGAADGFALQPSATLVFGLGAARTADGISVRWPSGRVTEVDRVAEGTLVVVREAPGASETEVSRLPYRRAWSEATRLPRAAAPVVPWVARLPAASPSTLRVLTTTATTCGVCRSELPRAARLARSFGEAELILYGVPVEPADRAAGRFAAWIAEQDPAWRPVGDVTEAEVEVLRAALGVELNRPPLPSSVVCDAEGRVLLATPGLPTVSDLQRLRSAKR